jgi:transposase
MPSPEQPMLFNEAEISRETIESEAETEAIRIDVKSYQRKAKRTKAELTKDLPQKDIIHELPEEALTDEEGNHYEYVTTNLVRNEMMIIPKQILVINHYQKVYKADVLVEGIPASKFLKAPVPKAVLPHSIANAATIANIMAEKYVNGMPLNRQEAEWNNRGVDFRRNTMANWIIRTVDYYLKDVYAQLTVELKKQDVIHADETPVQVLKEDGKTPESKSYMWVYSSSAKSDHQIRIFDYKSSRSGNNAKEFLEGYHNILVSDGFSGYNKIEKDVIRAGCWAHVRRKWKEAMPAGATPENSSAARGFKFCSRIFSIEKRLKDLPAEERLKARIDQVKPVVDEYWNWLDELVVDS